MRNNNGLIFRVESSVAGLGTLAAYGVLTLVPVDGDNSVLHLRITCLKGKFKEGEQLKIQMSPVRDSK
jgi:hypothetical protein